MTENWQSLTKMTKNKDLVIERVKIKDTDIRIEGSFELPPLAKLIMEDQVFAAAFIKSHGSIKAMEKLFGISYPTVKNRLNRIAGQLDFINVDINVAADASDILDRLEKGEITAEQAMEELS